MRNFRTLIHSACAIALFSLPAVAATTTLQFSAVVDGEPLQFGAKRYASPTGSGEFVIEDFKFYLSNVVLRNSEKDSKYLQEDSYHLFRLDPDSSTFEVTLEDADARKFDTAEFGIGVDPERNTSIEFLRDLNPNNQMAWNWDVGYKFVLLEGMYYPENDGDPVPLVFHIGFSENYRVLTFDLENVEKKTSSRKASVLAFEVDVMEMFRDPKAIDFATLPSVKFDRELSTIMADNYADMISSNGMPGLLLESEQSEEVAD